VGVANGQRFFSHGRKDQEGDASVSRSANVASRAEQDIIRPTMVKHTRASFSLLGRTQKIVINLLRSCAIQITGSPTCLLNKYVPYALHMCAEAPLCHVKLSAPLDHLDALCTAAHTLRYMIVLCQPRKDRPPRHSRQPKTCINIVNYVSKWPPMSPADSTALDAISYDYRPSYDA